MHPEQLMWDRLRPLFQRHFQSVCRVETGATKRGLADVYALAKDRTPYWVELKVAKWHPRKRAISIALSQPQVAFATMHTGGPSVVACVAEVYCDCRRYYMIFTQPRHYRMFAEGKLVPFEFDKMSEGIEVCEDMNNSEFLRGASS